MPSHDEMKNKTIKKLQFGGWSKLPYRQIRQAVKKLIEKELKIKLVK